MTMCRKYKSLLHVGIFETVTQKSTVPVLLTELNYTAMSIKKYLELPKFIWKNNTFPKEKNSPTWSCPSPMQTENNSKSKEVHETAEDQIHSIRYHLTGD